MGAEQQKKAPWRKVLHAAQPYPDNHTDESFLQHLVLNLNVRPRRYWDVVYGTAIIVQQLSVVAAAVAVPVHLHEGRISFQCLMLLNVLMVLSGYGLCCLAGGEVLGGSLWRGARLCTLLVIGVYFQAPLLMSLARTISGDTIIACTAGLIIVHLYLLDYSFMNSATNSLQGSLSLGAAVCSSVLVASRLEKREHVFAHVLFSLELYLLSPFVRRYIKRASTLAHVLTTMCLCACAAMLLKTLSSMAAASFCAGVVFVSFVCPLWLTRIQKYKQKINGPWDEAVPKWSEKVSDFQRTLSSPPRGQPQCS